MAEYVEVADEKDIPSGTTKAVEIKHHRIVIAHTDSGYYAIENECSHDSAPISDGKLKGDVIICRRHGARFDVTNGAVMAPPAIVPLETYQLKIVNGKILVLLD